MKFALLTVSYSGLFYSGKALSVEEQIYKARELGLEGLAMVGTLAAGWIFSDVMSNTTARPLVQWQWFWFFPLA
jgi:hypothetical protein